VKQKVALKNKKIRTQINVIFNDIRKEVKDKTIPVNRPWRPIGL
jgi:hypothetical protein